MFKLLKSAYAALVESLNRHARTWLEIDQRTRAMFNLDCPDDNAGAPDLESSTPAALPSAQKAGIPAFSPAPQNIGIPAFSPEPSGLNTAAPIDTRNRVSVEDFEQEPIDPDSTIVHTTMTDSP